MKPWLAPDIAESIRSGVPKPWLAPDLAQAITARHRTPWTPPDMADEIDAIVDTGGGGGGGERPTGSVAFLDFVNDHYYAGGAEVADVTTLLGSDVDAGSTFNAADISASGLASTSMPNFIGALLADAVNAAGRSFVFELTTHSGAGNFELDQTTDFATFDPDYYFLARTAPSSTSFISTSTPGDADLTDAQLLLASAVNRVAFTVTPTHTAFSINGATAASKAVTASFAAIINAVIYGDYAFLHTIAVYPVQDDAALSTLSALSGGGVPEWVPADATTFADFVNGNYYDGVSVVIDPSDMFKSDDDDGDPWDVSLIVPDTGYYNPSGEAGASYQGQALISLGGEFVIVFELNLETSGDANFHFIAYDGSFSVGHTFITGQLLSGSDINLTDRGGAHPATDVGELVSGINRVAFRVSSSKLSISVNGRTTVTSVPDFPTPISVVTFYTNSNAGTDVIRSVTTYPNSTLDDDLSALSAL